jgi:hypothetical protein
VPVWDAEQLPKSLRFLEISYLLFCNSSCADYSFVDESADDRELHEADIESLHRRIA